MTQALASVLIASVVAAPFAMVVMGAGGGLGGLVIGVYLGFAIGSVALGWCAVKMRLGRPYAVSAAAVMLFTGILGAFLVARHAVSMRPGDSDDLALRGGRLPAAVLRVLL